MGNPALPLYIPILTADGTPFELYVCDASPFEGADGLIGPDVF
jgi:hypothetical protein